MFNMPYQEDYDSDSGSEVVATACNVEDSNSKPRTQAPSSHPSPESSSSGTQSATAQSDSYRYV